MRLSFIIIPLACILLFAACNSADMEQYLSGADSTQLAHDISSLQSPSRKIVKQATLKCRTTNIMNTVASLEKTTLSLGGLVSVSEMNNQVVQQKTLRHTTDSLKEVNIYSTTAMLELRVPTEHLDSMLRTLPAIVDFTEYRNIRQEDLTYAYLSNALKNEAVTKDDSHHHGVAKAETKTEHAAAANTVIDRRLQNLQILDDINYTKILIELTQPNQVYTAIIPDPNYAVSEPFLGKLQYNISLGWDMILNVLVAFVALWPFLVIGAGLWWLFKIKRRKRLVTIIHKQV
jgi:hypothetical protein